MTPFSHVSEIIRFKGMWIPANTRATWNDISARQLKDLSRQPARMPTQTNPQFARRAIEVTGPTHT